MSYGTNGGNGGYSRKKAVPMDMPRTPKEGRNSGLNTAKRRAQDGTRANASGKKPSTGGKSTRL